LCARTDKTVRANLCARAKQSIGTNLRRWSRYSPVTSVDGACGDESYYQTRWCRDPSYYPFETNVHF